MKINRAVIQIVLWSVLSACILFSCGGSGNSVSIPGDGTGSALLSWQSPTTDIYDYPLSSDEVAGYRIYYGTSSNDMQLVYVIDDKTTTQLDVTGLSPGSHYFSITALDQHGNEGPPSNVINKIIGETNQ